MSRLVLEGSWVLLEGADESNQEDIDQLDVARAALAEMGGWFSRPPPATPWGTMLIRTREGGVPIGVIDAMPLPGYPAVFNVSMFVDPEARGTGWAIDAYGVYISHIFDQGVRLVHHEVLEMNRSVRRIMRGALLEPTARLRDHGYAAGRLWDVLVYSYDRGHWDTVLAKFSGRRLGHPSPPPSPPMG